MRDTSPEAERILIDIYRKMSIQDKCQQWLSNWRTARQLHAAGMHLRKPNASRHEIHHDWVLRTLGPTLANVIGDSAMDTPVENVDVIERVIATFAALDIPYVLGGSIASSLLGRPRFTQDADIAVVAFAGKEEAWIAQVGPGFYVSLPAVQEAIRRRTSFNVIHFASGFKVDVFICKDRPFDSSYMSRRRPVELPDRPGHTIFLTSPEDLILLKLEWFRIGGEVSERQWSDIIGVLQAQSGILDEDYLDRWSTELRLSDLLNKARRESATSGGSGT